MSVMDYRAQKAQDMQRAALEELEDAVDLREEGAFVSAHYHVARAQVYATLALSYGRQS